MCVYIYASQATCQPFFICLIESVNALSYHIFKLQVLKLGLQILFTQPQES